MSRKQYQALIKEAERARGLTAADLATRVVEGAMEPSVAGNVLLARALRKVPTPSD